MVGVRLTRKQQQEQTRTALLRSAAAIAAEKGLQGASIDEIAAGAGYTKGAFYANFSSKDELYLAMLDETFAAALADIDRAVHSDAEVEDQARQAGLDFVAKMTEDPQWSRLFFEFTAHASRHEGFRVELVARQRAMRERIAALYAERAAQLGIVPALPMAVIAQMTSAMASGVALQRLIEPEIVSDDLFASMLVLFFAGLREQTVAADAAEGPPGPR